MKRPWQLTPRLARALNTFSSFTSNPSYNPHCSSISCLVLVMTSSAASKASSSPSIRLMIL
uniref:Sps1 n=1 Tax=Arundo donax TaxID=35708 RepID=A0A0A9SEW7_ARUDO